MCRFDIELGGNHQRLAGVPSDLNYLAKRARFRHPGDRRGDGLHVHGFRRSPVLQVAVAAVDITERRGLKNQQLQRSDWPVRRVVPPRMYFFSWAVSAYSLATRDAL